MILPLLSLLPQVRPSHPDVVGLLSASQFLDLKPSVFKIPS